MGWVVGRAVRGLVRVPKCTEVERFVSQESVRVCPRLSENTYEYNKGPGPLLYSPPWHPFEGFALCHTSYLVE